MDPTNYIKMLQNSHVANQQDDSLKIAILSAINGATVEFTPQEVKQGSDRNKEVAPQLATMCERMETLPDRLLMYTEDGEALLEKITHAGMHATTSLVRRSSLEDVFLRLTGRTLIE